MVLLEYVPMLRKQMSYFALGRSHLVATHEAETGIDPRGGEIRMGVGHVPCKDLHSVELPAAQMNLTR